MKTLLLAVMVAVAIAVQADEYDGIAVPITPAAAAVDEETVFYGLPATRVTASPGSQVTTQLTQDQAEINAVEIVRRGTSYFWKTRSDRPLQLTISGIYWTFVDPANGSYVKLEMISGKAVEYLEHVQIGLETITYFGWGEPPALEPAGSGTLAGSTS